jgi:hypothetical protein
MFQGRIGNGAEDGLFGVGTDDFAESCDARAARDDHNVGLGYRHRQIAKSGHIEVNAGIAE